MEQGADILSALLSDPEKLSAAVSAVSSMLGSQPQGGDGAPPEAVRLPQVRSDGAALINALKPFLSPERRERADKAARLLALASLATEFREIR